MDFYIGQIVLFAFPYAPINFLPCNGQIVSISQYPALFALLGNAYGGDFSNNNFALPNLNGRVPVGMGQDQMGNNYVIGQIGGQTNVTLNQQNIGIRQAAYVNSVTPSSTTVAVASSFALPEYPIPTQPPFLALNYCICVNGIYPTRPE